MNELLTFATRSFAIRDVEPHDGNTVNSVSKREEV